MGETYSPLADSLGVARVLVAVRESFPARTLDASPVDKFGDFPHYTIRAAPRGAATLRLGGNSPGHIDN